MYSASQRQLSIPPNNFVPYTLYRKTFVPDMHGKRDSVHYVTWLDSLQDNAEDGQGEPEDGEVL